MSWLTDAKEYTITTLNFESLMALDGYTADDGEPLLSSVMRMYLESTPQSLKQMEEAVTAGDQFQVHHIAHGLKSTSANLGALHLASLCEKVEDLADPELHKTMVDCSSFIGKILREFLVVQRDMLVIQHLVRGQPVPAELLQS